MSTVLTALLSLAVGVGSNFLWSYIQNTRSIPKDADQITGTYRAYWYDSQEIRSSDPVIGEAEVNIYKNWLNQLKVEFVEIDPPRPVTYEYEGTCDIFDSQIHWTMEGRNHREKYYAIFDRGLNRQIDSVAGIFLITSNDPSKDVLAIRCILCQTELSISTIQSQLGQPEWYAVR